MSRGAWIGGRGRLRWLTAAAAIAAGAMLVWLADLWLQPAPLPAAFAVLAGAAALGWRAGNRRPAAVWALAGLLLGVGVHLLVHLTGGSPEPAGGVPGHLALDGARSAVVALAALVVVDLLVRALRRGPS